jgi:hypothetical protein
MESGSLQRLDGVDLDERQMDRAITPRINNNQPILPIATFSG